MRWRILDAFAEAAALEGIPATAGFNGGYNSGVGYFQANQKNGCRWSAARGFLKPALKRPNLKLETGVLIDRILIENGNATGVVYRRGHQVFTAHTAGEIVVATGAVSTPALLERSGIGAGTRLKSLGVDVTCNLAGVGKNLQDHLQLRPMFKVSGVPTMNVLYSSIWRRPLMALDYGLFRRGPMTMAPSQMGAFAKSSASYATPNLQFHVQPLSLDKFGEPLHRDGAITISVCNLRPTSRGHVHARSTDPHAKPEIRPNYLSTREDERVAIDSLRLVRRIAAQSPLAQYRASEFRPGREKASDEDLLLAARDLGTTIFHPVGTAKMGAADDPMAVVDEQLRVRGIDGLRIADASVMPNIVSANTNSPTMMIAEKAALLTNKVRQL